MELRNVCVHPALSDWAERSSGGGGAAEHAADAVAQAAAAAAAGAAVGPGAAAGASPVAASAAGEDEAGGEGGAKVGADRLVHGSGKLSLLDAMLRQLHAAGKRVMVLAQSPKALDAVEVLARERYGGSTAADAAAAPSCHERVDTTTKTAQRQEAVARFNSDPSRWLFLQHTRSCGVGTDLPGIDAAIFLDSDWSARKDAQVREALGRGWDGEGEGGEECRQVDGP